jgi:hypothetical protein
MSGLYQAHQEQSPQMHSKRRALPGRTVAAKGRHRKNNDSTKIAKSHIASSIVRPSLGTPTLPIAVKTETPSSSQLHDESVVTPTIAAKTETPPSSQLHDESVMKKAKATIAAKMNDPNSVEFEDMKRAVRKTRLATLLTLFVASSEKKTADPNRFYISSKKTRRTSAATL